jgi:hypothetical protein
MTKLVEQFAAQLSSADSKTLADLRDFVDWQIQAQGVFIPDALDDVAIRSYLLHSKLSGTSRLILQRTIASLTRLRLALTNHTESLGPVCADEP